MPGGVPGGVEFARPRRQSVVQRGRRGDRGGAVVVEVMLKIDGLGDLLWAGTLEQDFGLVLATATLFAFGSALLLLMQAFTEVAVALLLKAAATDDEADIGSCSSIMFILLLPALFKSVSCKR